MKGYKLPKMGSRLATEKEKDAKARDIKKKCDAWSRRILKKV